MALKQFSLFLIIRLQTLCQKEQQVQKNMKTSQKSIFSYPTLNIIKSKCIQEISK